MKGELLQGLDCPSGKTAFPCRQDAERALIAAANHPPRRADRRSRKTHAPGRRWAVYQCGMCRLWHLTSNRRDEKLAREISSED